MQLEFISLAVKNIVKPKLTFLSYTLQSCTLKETCKIFFVTWFLTTTCWTFQLFARPFLLVKKRKSVRATAR